MGLGGCSLGGAGSWAGQATRSPGKGERGRGAGRGREDKARLWEQEQPGPWQMHQSKVVVDWAEAQDRPGDYPSTQVPPLGCAGVVLGPGWDLTEVEGTGGGGCYGMERPLLGPSGKRWQTSKVCWGADI